MISIPAEEEKEAIDLHREEEEHLMNGSAAEDQVLWSEIRELDPVVEEESSEHAEPDPEDVKLPDSAPLDMLVDPAQAGIFKAAQPGRPTQEQVDKREHEGHSDIKPWCVHRLAGQAKENPHRRLPAQKTES